MSEKRDLPYPEVCIDRVRSYVQGRADFTSVRAIAAELGLGHTSLMKFLEGSEPYAKNRRRLVEWWLREHQAQPVRGEMSIPKEVKGSGALPPERPAEYLDALVSELRGEARTEARLRITNALA